MGRVETFNPVFGGWIMAKRKALTEAQRFTTPEQKRIADSVKRLNQTLDKSPQKNGSIKERLEAIEDRTYYVQVLCVREVQVETHDDLAAEREAFQKLSEKDQGTAIAICVLNRSGDQIANDNLGEAGLGGALAYEDAGKNWSVAREAFEGIDLSWVRG
jgi:hypothetical protein